MTTAPIASLPYYGGKSVSSHRTGAGKWVADLLPDPAGFAGYCELCAGMLGVLLQRRRSKLEIVNDLDGNLYAFWKTIRDHPEQLAHRFKATPKCRRTFNEAKSLLTSGPVDPNITTDDLIERGWATAVVLVQGYHHTTSPTAAWVQPGKTDSMRGFLLNDSWQPRLEQLTNRMRTVQIENIDALELLQRLINETDFVVYFDPPYPSVENKYRHSVDVTAALELVAEAKPRIAISGYPNEPWETLSEQHGWVRSTREVITAMNHNHGDTARTEVVWTNFEPAMRQLSLLG